MLYLKASLTDGQWAEIVQLMLACIMDPSVSQTLQTKWAAVLIKFLAKRHEPSLVQRTHTYLHLLVHHA